MFIIMYRKCMWIYKLYNDINVYTTSCSLGNYDFQWCRTLINLDDRCERSEYSRGQYIEKEKKNIICVDLIIKMKSFKWVITYIKTYTQTIILWVLVLVKIYTTHLIGVQTQSFERAKRTFYEKGVLCT